MLALKPNIQIGGYNGQGFENREFEFNAHDFEIMANLVYEFSGIVVGPSKFDMVYSRLSRRLRELGIATFSDYCQLIRTRSGRDEFLNFINAMTTNLTRFFRESHHFDYLNNTVFAELRKQRSQSKRVRIWSAGCSTGEEAYSIAMCVKENFPEHAHYDTKILATDLDTKVLATASLGQYSFESMSEVPKKLRDIYFKPINEKYLFDQDLARLICFKSLNLVRDWPMKGPFDIIFCRNVMIYFDGPTKLELINRFASLLKPGGYLFVGHSETLLDQPCFKLVGKTIYQRLAS